MAFFPDASKYSYNTAIPSNSVVNEANPSTPVVNEANSFNPDNSLPGRNIHKEIDSLYRSIIPNENRFDEWWSFLDEPPSATANETSAGSLHLSTPPPFARNCPSPQQIDEEKSQQIRNLAVKNSPFFPKTHRQATPVQPSLDRADDKPKLEGRDDSEDLIMLEEAEDSDDSDDQYISGDQEENIDPQMISQVKEKQKRNKKVPKQPYELIDYRSVIFINGQPTQPLTFWLFNTKKYTEILLRSESNLL